MRTGGLVSLKDRRNGGVRFVIVTCPEGQVAQCRGDHFGSLDQTVAALTPLADDYARGVLTRVELKKELERIKKEKEQETGKKEKEREKEILKKEIVKKEILKKEILKKEILKKEILKKEILENEISKKEINKKGAKRTRDEMFDDEDTLPWGLDVDAEMLFTSTRTATDD